MKQIALIGLMLCFYSRGLASKPCVFSLNLDSKKSLNRLNFSSDGSVLFVLMGNQSNCFIDLDFVYEQALQNTLGEVAEQNLDENEVLKEYNFFCDKNIAIHFVTNSTNAVGKLKISVALVFGRCDVYLNELSLFLKYGNIWSILQSNDSVIHTPSHRVSCPFTKHIRFIAAKINCDAVNITKFFWEFCTEIFEKVNTLQLKACKTNHFNMTSDTLVKSFPKLQSLQLVNIDLATQMTFPWTQSYIDVENQDLVKFLSDETVTNITVNSMGRTFRIQYSKFNTSGMLHLNGNIATVVINNAAIKQNESQLFENVTGLYQVDLSSNNLTELNKLLFDNQSEIQDIHLKNNKLSNLPSQVFEDQHKLVFLDLSGNLLSSIDSKLLENQRYLQELHLENNRLQFLPQDFLKEQIYSLKFLYLYSNPLKTIPVMPFYGTKLELIDIHNSLINGESIIELVNTLRLYDFVYAEAEREASDPSRKVGKLPLQQRVFDLSFCKIRDIRVDLNVRNKTVLNLLQLFQSFHIKGDGNPFTCNCQLYVVTLLLSAEEKKGVNMDWTCMYPQELQGRAVKSLTERDIYCPVNATDCPSLCVCYVRYDFSSLIVDCRNIKFSSLPLEMPKYPMELWFKNASLFTIEPRDYLLNVSVLDLSENKLTYISPLAASALQNVVILNLENNDLTSLPVQIKYMNISKISLIGNAFLCDCHTRWMRVWLHDRMCPVTDWNIIKCTDNKKKVNTFITLPDSLFVCNKIKAPSIAEHVIFPSVVIGSALFVILVLSLIIYFQRFTVRVLLYMVFGVRICDAFTEKSDDFSHDCVVIYDKTDGDFFKINIIKYFQESGYKVADMYKDPIIGFTFVEGIKKLINKSRRCIFCMTIHSQDSELMSTLWSIASERAMKNHIGSIILIVDKYCISNCTDENMKLYIRNGKYIKLDSELLQKSIEYLLSTKKRMNKNQEVNRPEDNCTENDQVDEIGLCECIPPAAAANVQENTANGNDISYIVYPDGIDELHHLTRYEIIPFLRKNKQNVCVLQDEFVFGEDIRFGIEPKLDEAKHVICIISNDTLEDDVKQFVLTTILTKAVVSSSNYLLLFSYDQINMDKMAENLKKYVNSYITASVNDPNFKERMLEALMFDENDSEKDTDSLVTLNDEDDASLI